MQTARTIKTRPPSAPASAAFAAARPHLAIVSGTRPEIIKLAPVFHALRDADFARVTWIHTGQHAQMADDMFACFDIEPEHRLTRSASAIEHFSAHCRIALDALMAAQRFDLCIVQGDTESAFLGALCAFYRQVPVAHVEAGLRTHTLARPFPEEGLRQMISRLAATHYAPTVRAALALQAEGVPADRIEVTGNTVVDAQLWACKRHGIERRRQGAGHVVVSVHRREHWGREMEEIFSAIAELASAHPRLEFRFPVHLNPIVQMAARRALEGLRNVRLSAPFDYLQMQQALADAALVLTDSGGLQEEAPTFGVPVVVLREETERPEAVEAGCAVIAGPRRQAIVDAAQRILAAPSSIAQRLAANPYGDGRAAARIVRRIAAHFHQPAPFSPESRHERSKPLPLPASP
jgi:UDP-N-acetylglucosamine 2-epimerase (non-hydrolysing)